MNLAPQNGQILSSLNFDCCRRFNTGLAHFECCEIFLVPHFVFATLRPIAMLGASARVDKEATAFATVGSIRIAHESHYG
jgi:hypothetical protein